MSSIQDLRDTLEQHARGVHDIEVGERPSAVRRRVRTARRRRAAATGVGAVAAAAAVVAVVTVPGADGPPAPADRELVGLTAPETLTSLGYTYAFAEGVEGDGRAAVDLSDHDGPVLVTWATEGDDDRVRVRTFGGDPLHEQVADFTGLVPVWEPGGRVVVTGEGRVAAAVYTLTDDRPEGLTVDGATLREEVGDMTLLAGDVGEAGEVDLTVEAVVPESGRVSMHSACRQVPDGYVVVEQYGDPGLYSFGECDRDEPLVDAAAEDHGPLDLAGLGLEPGDTVTVRTFVAEEFGKAEAPRPVDGTDPALADVRLAVGLYEGPTPAVVQGGVELDRVVEHDGHRWELFDSAVTDPGTAELAAGAPAAAAGPTLVLAQSSGIRPGTVAVLRGSRTLTTSSNGTGGLAGFTERVVEDRPGRVYRIDARRAVGPRTVLALGFYQRAD